MTNKVPNVSFVKPRVRVFTRSDDNMKQPKPSYLLNVWSKDKSIDPPINKASLNPDSKQINHFYDLRV